MSESKPFGVRYLQFVDILAFIFCLIIGGFLAAISMASFQEAFKNSTGLQEAVKGSASIAYWIGITVAGLLSFSLAMIPGALLIWLAKGIGRGQKAARVWQIVLSGFSVLLFPVGTILHSAALYFILFDQRTKITFNQNDGVNSSNKQ